LSLTDLRPSPRSRTGIDAEATAERGSVNVNDHGGVHVQVQVNVKVIGPLDLREEGNDDAAKP
jgi:hypothetical protein